MRKHVFLGLLIGTWGSCQAEAFIGAHDCCCACPSTRSDATCYVGSLDFKLKHAQSRDFTVLYQGTSVKVHDGMYCFKESEVNIPLFMLFVDPSYIAYRNDECTVSNLALREKSTYHCVLLTRIERAPTGTETIFDWHVTPCMLGSVVVNSKTYLQIPAHTIIIPLSGRFFEKSRDGYLFFTGRSSKDEDRIIHLPAPRVRAGLSKKLLQALDRADIALLNLKNIHTPQERCQICMDKRNLIQE